MTLHFTNALLIDPEGGEHLSELTVENGLIAAFILTWAKALGEFGATLMVAGSMAMRTETLPVAIFMRLSSADIEGTVALILILVAIGLTALYAARRILGRAAHA